MGSAFAGLGANNIFYNTILGICMFFARLLAGHSHPCDRRLSCQEENCSGEFGNSSDSYAAFHFLLVGIVILVGGLDLFPALALGPIVEHLTLAAA